MKKNLIAFIGLSRSGKDTAAAALVNQGWELIKFADGLKTMLRAYFGFMGAGPREIERLIEGDMKEWPTHMLSGKTTRWAMQSLGTEWGRELIGHDIWVNAALAHASQFDKVVISDCRFPNEAKAIQAQGGKIVRIVREGLSADSHPSEQLIATLPEDIRILNSGTVDYLQQKVLQLINQ